MIDDAGTSRGEGERRPDRGTDAAAAPAGGRALMIYDGDCGFCRRWIARWRRLTGDAVAYAPFQRVGDRFPAIGEAAFASAVHLVEPGGRVTRGAEAVLRALVLAPEPRPLHRLAEALYRRLPPFARLAEWAYAWVARHRRLASRLAPGELDPGDADSDDPDPGGPDVDVADPHGTTAASDRTTAASDRATAASDRAAAASDRAAAGADRGRDA